MSKTKKKRRNGQLFFLTGLLVVVLGGYIGLTVHNKQKEAAEEAASSKAAEEDATGVATLTDIALEDLANITYTNSGGTYSFNYTDGTFTYADAENITVNQTTLGNLADAALELNGKVEVADNLDDLAEFSLDEPLYTVVITDTSGNVTTIYVGTEYGDYDYVYLEGQTSVYTVNALSTYLEDGILDLVEEDTIPQVDDEDFRYVQYSDDDTNLTLEYFESGNTESDLTNAENWFQLINNKYFVLDDDAREEFTGVAGALSFDSVAAINPTEEELETYGLADPAATLYVKYVEVETSTAETGEYSTDDDGETVAETTTTTTTYNYDFTFYIGGQNEDGDYYAMLEGSSMIGVISADDAAYLLNTVQDYSLITMDPLMATITNLDRIDVVIGDEEWDMTITSETTTNDDGDSETTYTYFINGEEVDETAFKTLYKGIIGLEANQPVQAGSTFDTDETLMTITLYGIDGQRESLKATLSPYNDNFYVLTVDGETLWYINAADFTSLSELFHTDLDTLTESE